MRLFIAVNLPESIRAALYEAAGPLRAAAPAVRWVSADTLHITLSFLGETAQHRLADIQGALLDAARGLPAFELRVGGAGAFPTLQRPRVYWLGADGGPALLRLQRGVEDAIEPLGFPRETRPFHPHLTLGRVGDRLPAEQAQAAERCAGTLAYQTVVPVRSVELMQSQLARTGARYSVVTSAALAAAE